MRNKLFNVALALIVIVVGKYVIVAQAPITGEWTAEMRTEKQDKNDFDAKASSGSRVQLNFKRTTARGGHNSNGNSYNFSELQGLRPDSNGRVSFSLVREAGTVECEGTFVNGRGSGTFRFSPNRGFLDAMKSRGFDFEAASNSKGGDSDTLEERLLSAALINVTTSIADDINSANFGKLTVDDLFKASIFKIDGKFMAEMKATGFPNLGMEELVKARIFKVDSDFVREMKDTGFPNLGMEELVKARIFKIDAEFVRKIASMGFSNRDFEELVKFSIFKVTPEFLNELRAAGLEKLDAEEVVKARIFNISPEYVRQAKAQDPNITMEDLVQMKIGVKRFKKDN